MSRSETTREDMPAQASGAKTLMGATGDTMGAALDAPTPCALQFRSLADEHTIGVSEFLRRAGIGRTLLYDLIDRGEIDTVLVSDRRLVLVESWLDYLERRRAAERRGEIGRRGNRLRRGLGPSRSAAAKGGPEPR